MNVFLLVLPLFVVGVILGYFRLQQYREIMTRLTEKYPKSVKKYMVEIQLTKNLPAWAKVNKMAIYPLVFTNRFALDDELRRRVQIHRILYISLFVVGILAVILVTTVLFGQASELFAEIPL